MSGVAGDVSFPPLLNPRAVLVGPKKKLFGWNKSLRISCDVVVVDGALVPHIQVDETYMAEKPKTRDFPFLMTAQTPPVSKKYRNIAKYEEATTRVMCVVPAFKSGCYAHLGL